MHVMVVEDDLRVAGTMRSVLRRHGYEVTGADNGTEALDRCDGSVDMVLLDLGLPDMDGNEVCIRLRRRMDVPIIVVTARSEMGSMVHLLGLGADDYLVKPFDLRELIARIEAVGRRHISHTADRPSDRYVQIGTVRLDRAARKLWVDERLVMLTRKEFDLFAALARHPGIALRREQLISEVWQTSWHGMGRSLEVHIASLRNKVGVAGLIETVRGIGYALTAE
ncbi:response regulator transcription factor [Nakamurella lactea]|uniref:response regulator transcription factor n=1 Tax=Nakamurella lactea TaxID=459515 RepID=UPI00040CA195|nr:response regulator transcription factor [Nakamurella lactea]